MRSCIHIVDTSDEHPYKRQEMFTLSSRQGASLVSYSPGFRCNCHTQCRPSRVQGSGTSTL